MSTYDAYNLSLRDSTEFTVPTGESGGDSQLDIVDVTINVNGSVDGLFSVVRSGSFLVEEDDGMIETYYNTNKVISNMPAGPSSLFEDGSESNSIINAHVVIPHNGATFIVIQSGSSYLVSDISSTGDVELMEEGELVIVRGPGTLTFTITPVGGFIVDPSNP